MVKKKGCSMNPRRVVVKKGEERRQEGRKERLWTGTEGSAKALAT